MARDSSDLYSSLFEKGLINRNFSTEYFIGNGYEAVIFEVVSRDENAVAQAIKADVAFLRENGISPERFEIARRSLYGKEIMSYNNVDDLANGLVSCEFGGYGIFDSIDVFRSTCLGDIESLLAEKLDEKYSALSVVKSKDNK